MRFLHSPTQCFERGFHPILLVVGLMIMIFYDMFIA